jgi:cytochrome P450
MPISIFMEHMGLPIEGFSEFRGLALQILNPDVIFGDISVMAEANGKIIEILSELIAVRSRQRKNDLVSALLDESVNGQKIGGAELMSICYVLFLGGLDTVTNAMSFGIRHLARDPGLQDEIRKDPSRIPDLVEMLLRMSAFINVQRLVKTDTALGGVRLKAGDIVWNMTWPGSNAPGGEPQGSRHLAFGSGHHTCAGMHLARLELRIMYETWFRHIGRFSLAPDDEPAMGGGPVMHIRRLRLNLEAATPAGQ